ncbi:long-chain fatty acid transport protein 4-like isoform X3 [Rhodnius prolixus]|uniref:long-chain fatty acid transport protein 4-like isoform X3 n=2 Tax=Rhodnius prolixus TaxID=13249 RepID=UPI003D18B128
MAILLLFIVPSESVMFVYRMSQLVSRTRKYERANLTVVSAFRRQLAKTPDKPIYLFGESVWNMNDVELYSNKVANMFLEAGFKKSDVVGLMMTNRPEFICIWLGLAKLGIITALINTNLRGQSLKHCVGTANCKAIIFSEDVGCAVKEVCTDLPLYQSDGVVTEIGVTSLMQLLAVASSEAPSVKDILLHTDKLLYIYTSGTTGLPKAAILPHSRFIMATMATMSLLKVKNDDIIYNPLPLYHTAGGALGAGPALLEGITTVLRHKFSASSYIPDCIRYKCTIGQYIGEMCRYMLAVPPRPDDTAHYLRFMIGNGLRPAIWSAFVRRFQVPQITEVYGATEGNVNIANLDNTIGAVGSLPRCLPEFLFPLAVIRIDPETEEPVRGKDGLCIRCKTDESGMFVGLIKNNDPSRQFHGYVNQAESKKKIIYDVFTKGDSAFVSGDIMVMDELGYIYFKDRTGDTFRWKGENIATSEVEAVVSTVAGLKDCTVYGVKVGDLEGKAGMAAVVDPLNELDLPAFANAIDMTLPNYARPLFLRILRTMELTGTFKMKKIQLQKQGFDPEEISDKLYFRQGSTYVPLTKHLYTSIIAGNTKL